MTLEFRYRLLYKDPAISYDLRDGAWPEGVKEPPTSHSSTGDVVNVPNPVKDGWTFAGWTVEQGGTALEGLYTNYGIPADSNAYKLTANWRQSVELYYRSDGTPFPTAFISNTEKLPGKLGTGAYQSMVSQWYYMENGSYVPLPSEYDPYQKSSPTLNAAPTAATLYGAGYTKLYADVMERSGDEYIIDSVTDLYFMKRCVNDGGMDLYLTEDPLPGRLPSLDLNKQFCKENYRLSARLTLTEAWTDTIGNSTREFTGNFAGGGGWLTFNNIQAPVFDSIYGKVDARISLEDTTEHSTFPILANDVKDGAEVVEVFVELGTFRYGSGASGDLGLLVGWNEGKIRNCSVEGTVYLNGSALSSLSGIASQNFIGASQNTGDKYETIFGAECINTCTVKLTCTVNNARIDNLAGIVWNNAGTVKNCPGTVTVGLTNGGTVGASSAVSITRDEMYGEFQETGNTITIEQL